MKKSKYRVARFGRPSMLPKKGKTVQRLRMITTDLMYGGLEAIHQFVSEHGWGDFTGSIPPEAFGLTHYEKMGWEYGKREWMDDEDDPESIIGVVLECYDHTKDENPSFTMWFSEPHMETSIEYWGKF